jgi:hypothetical protein
MDYTNAAEQGLEGRAQEEALEHARATLAAMPAGVRWQAALLFAAAPTERLFGWYDQRPVEQQGPYARTWRPVLDAVWAYAGGDDTAYRVISRALGEFYLSPYSTSGYDDGPEDINENEPAAAYATANCAIHGMVAFAMVPASRALEQLDFDWSGVDEARRVALLGAELDRQAADLAVIVRLTEQYPHLPGGVPVDVITELRAKPV